MRTIILGTAFGCTIVALACAGGAPTAPTTATAPTPQSVLITPSALADEAGVQKKTISGTMNIFGITPPARTVTTPSGMCQAFHVFEYTSIYGDLEGTVTYDVNAHQRCDNTHLVANGPFTGEITFQGRTGTVTGQFTTNCKFADSVGSVSCDGTMTLRGAGDLDGYQFHYTWGPGWWPFSYSGTAFWR